MPFHFSREIQMIEINSAQEAAVEICKEARAPWRDREKLKELIEQHGIDAAAEALEYLGQIIPQAGKMTF
jgi:hypothetical protein